MAKLKRPKPGHELISLQVMAAGVPLHEALERDLTWVGIEPGINFELLITVPANSEWLVIPTLDGLNALTKKRQPIEEASGYIMTPHHAVDFPNSSRTYRDGNVLRRYVRGFRISNSQIELFLSTRSLGDTVA